MSSVSSVGDNWLLVEWLSGGRQVVYVKSILYPVDRELEIGESLSINKNGEPEAAILIARSRKRDTLEAMIVKEEGAGPSRELNEDEEGEDFCSSASSWTPSDDDAPSDDSDKVTPKKKNLELYKRQYTNRSNKKVLTPSNKANAVVNVTNRKRSHKETAQNQNKKIVKTEKTNKKEPMTVKINRGVKSDFKDIINRFDEILKYVESLKKPVHVRIAENPEGLVYQSIVTPTCYKENGVHTMNGITKALDLFPRRNVESENDELDRSDDNVLISNKYSNASIKPEAVPESREDPNEEWVPIGSGKTLIHKDKFKKINWKSYTVATRALMIAVFPRKVLATHSLTGKCSPAFMHKPAKMCLDPKKTCDIILEIMDRFKVRENLVRSVITTKCADEAKMLKLRNNKSIKDKKKQNDTEKDEKQQKLQTPAIL